MATTGSPRQSRREEKFSRRLLKFAARTVGLAVVALALVVVGSMQTGFLQWVLVGAGVLLFIGLEG